MELPVTKGIMITRPVCLLQRGSGLDVHYIYEYYNKIGCHMLKSSRGNVFNITGPLGKESVGHVWFPLTRGQQCEAVVFYFILFYFIFG